MLNEEIAQKHRRVVETQINILEEHGCFDDAKTMYGPSLVLDNMVKDLENSQEQRVRHAQLKQMHDE
jgi:hypothetical protein